MIELEPMLDEYYRARGWDVETGLPTQAKLAMRGKWEALERYQERLKGGREK